MMKKGGWLPPFLLRNSEFIRQRVQFACPQYNWNVPGYRKYGKNHISSTVFETHAFLAHKTHQPSGLTGPSTRWHVFFAELKFMQLLHFCSPFG
jgi:hypothetical protein